LNELDELSNLDRKIKEIESYLAKNYNSIMIHLTENRKKLQTLIEILKSYEEIIKSLVLKNRKCESEKNLILMIEKRIAISKSQLELLVHMIKLKEKNLPIP